MKYAKLVNGTLQYAPRNKGSVSNYNQDVTAMLADGYLPVEETAYPKDGNNYSANYAEAEGKIVQSWMLVPTPEPVPLTIEQQVATLEAITGLTRVMREMVLAENSGASDYVKAKANEIEELAKQLRTTEETPKPETVDNTQNDEYNSFGDTKQ